MTLVVRIGDREFRVHSVAQAVELILKTREDPYFTHGEGD